MPHHHLVSLHRITVPHPSFGQPTQINNTGNAQQQNSSAGNATGVDAKSILAVHNRERAAVGVPPLVWSDKITADAKVWADTLAAGKNVGGPHDPEAFAKFGEGENIVTHGPPSVTADRNDKYDRDGLGRRKGQLSRQSDRVQSRGTGERSLHADGLEYHERGRLRDSQIDGWG